MPAPETDGRPLISFDLDGVLVRPPGGRNLTMGRNLSPRPADAAALRHRGEAQPSRWDRLLMRTYYRARYAGRSPMAGAAALLEAAAQRHRLIALSGRSWRGRAQTERWLQKHGLRQRLRAVVLNDTRLPAAQFKLEAAQRLAVGRHVDDDAATAALLAQAGIPVDLIDWPCNRGLAFPAGVQRWADLAALAEALRAADEC